MSFENKSAVVTGAGGGMGLAIAAALAERGTTVTAVDLKDRPTSLPDGCGYVQADITEEGLPQRVVESAGEDGRLDFLVNAAGVGWFGKDRSIVDTEEQVWDRVIAINLTAPMRFARAAIPAMRRAGGGAMVHIASIAGLRGMDEPMDAYQVSKAGLISLSRGIGVHLGPEDIRSNTICPGAIETPMVAEIYAEDPSRRERMAAKTPIRRLGTPEDISSSCLHLLSDEASFVTATDVVVDGGWLSVLR
jgi:NAD(P)-dependent dehydrogenase (short-subunit alcohol dehydrogenase family)